MFCPKCGSIMMPKAEKGKKLLACSCGYKSGGEITLTETAKKTKELEVIDTEHENLPVVEAKCKKCGHDKAYFWSLQTRSADEPETRFYKCEQCKYTWREYK
ncbi:transcription factor S [Candidatus Woesearchaeota archaeon]|nr:transcription factor S [Candidatus Woesearchaeota archaeon]